MTLTEFLEKFKIAICVLIVVVILSAGCEDNDVVDPNPPKTMPLFTFTNPAWSPDSNYILMTYQANPFKYPDTLGMYRYDLLDSSYTGIITGGAMGADNPCFSPDGRWIAFTWCFQIYKATAEGDSITQLTFEGRNFEPAWSPDGSRIAYFRLMSGIHLINSDGSGDNLLMPGRSPQWVDDTHLLYLIATSGHTSDSIFMIDLESEEKERIFSIRDNWIEFHYISYNREISSILFTLAVEEQTHPAFWRVDLDGSNLKPIVKKGGGEACWSPDGSKIVYVNTYRGEIWVVNSDGSNPRALLNQ